jgi:hypothetical protein
LILLKIYSAVLAPVNVPTSIYSTSKIFLLGSTFGLRTIPGGKVLAKSPILYGLSGLTKLTST